MLGEAYLSRKYLSFRDPSWAFSEFILDLLSLSYMMIWYHFNYSSSVIPFFCILFLILLRQDLCACRLCSTTWLIMSKASLCWHRSHLITAGVWKDDDTWYMVFTKLHSKLFWQSHIRKRVSPHQENRNVVSPSFSVCNWSVIIFLFCWPQIWNDSLSSCIGRVFFNGILYQYKLKYGCDEMIEGIGHICVPTNCLVFWN